MVWATLVAAGLSYYQSEKSRKDANDANIDLLNRELGSVRTADLRATPHLDRQARILTQRLSALDEGYSRAIGQVQRAESARRFEIQAQGKQNTASVQQDMARRGLGNTTVAQNAARGVGFDTQRAMSNLDSQLAGQYAGLEQQRAQAISTGLAGLAQQSGARADYELALAGRRQSALGNVAYSAGQPLDLGGLAALASSFQSGG